MKRIKMGNGAVCAVLALAVFCAPSAYAATTSPLNGKKIIGTEAISRADLIKIPLADFNIGYGKDSDGDGLSDDIQKALGINTATKKNKVSRKKNILKGIEANGGKKLPIHKALSNKLKGKLLQEKTWGTIYEWYVNPYNGKLYFLGEIKKNEKFVASTGLVKVGSDKKPVLVAPSDDYLGSLLKGNYVYGGAMHLAWNDLSENILKDAVKLNTKNASALATAASLNKKTFSKKDLDEPSYYIKSGYGQQTVDAINRESRAKFPDKSFADLSVQLEPDDIISYAYFLKKVAYLVKFEERSILFNGKSVKGFGASSYDQRKNVDIMRYDSDDKFIVRLKLKDATDELYVVKGYDMKSPTDAVAAVNAHTSAQSMEEKDVFKMPKLHVDHKRNYSEMIDVPLANKGFEKHAISQMFENIKFDMDEAGARVENEAGMIVGTTSAPMQPEKIKYLVLDKPFWVIMKRADSNNPYFTLGAANTELMQVEK